MLSIFNMSAQEIILTLLIRVFMIVAILPLHEFAHAFAAKRMGDRTAEMLGRLTINPIKHIDPIGSICLLIAGIGWAKPVPVYSGNFRWRNKKGAMAVVAAAGPLSNFIIAFLGMVILRVFWIFADPSAASTFYAEYVISSFIIINLNLGVFNLFPIPPLDGSKIMFAFLPDKWIYNLEKYSLILIVVLIASPIGGIINYVSGSIFELYAKILF